MKLPLIAATLVLSACAQPITDQTYHGGKYATPEPAPKVTRPECGDTTLFGGCEDRPAATPPPPPKPGKPKPPKPDPCACLPAQTDTRKA